MAKPVYVWTGTAWALVGDGAGVSGSDVAMFARAGTASTTTGTMRWPIPFNSTVISVQAMANTAPAGAAIIVDVNKNGTTIFTTQANRPTIAAGTNYSGLVTNMNVTALSQGDYLTVDIDQVGSTTAGADVTVLIRYKEVI